MSVFVISIQWSTSITHLRKVVWKIIYNWYCWSIRDIKFTGKAHLRFLNRYFLFLKKRALDTTPFFFHAQSFMYWHLLCCFLRHLWRNLIFRTVVWLRCWRCNLCGRSIFSNVNLFDVVLSFIVICICRWNWTSRFDESMWWRIIFSRIINAWLPRTLFEYFNGFCYLLFWYTRYWCNYWFHRFVRVRRSHWLNWPRTCFNYIVTYRSLSICFFVMRMNCNHTFDWHVNLLLKFKFGLDILQWVCVLCYISLIFRTN